MLAENIKPSCNLKTFRFLNSREYTARYSTERNNITFIFLWPKECKAEPCSGTVISLGLINLLEINIDGINAKIKGIVSGETKSYTANEKSSFFSFIGKTEFVSNKINLLYFCQAELNLYYQQNRQKKENLLREIKQFKEYYPRDTNNNDLVEHKLFNISTTKLNGVDHEINMSIKLNKEFNIKAESNFKNAPKLIYTEISGEQVHLVTIETHVEVSSYSSIKIKIIGQQLKTEEQTQEYNIQLYTDINDEMRYFPTDILNTIFACQIAYYNYQLAEQQKIELERFLEIELNEKKEEKKSFIQQIAYQFVKKKTTELPKEMEKKEKKSFIRSFFQF